MPQLKRRAATTIGLALLMSAPPAVADTYSLVDGQLYRLSGHTEPVLGHKLKRAVGPNFLACDGTFYTASPSQLTPSTGGCGDSNSEVTILLVKVLKNGQLTVF